jgi:tetratricopeptide (TPR) repeat protein
MADRYTYIPLIGMFIAVAWGVPALAWNLPYRRPVLAGLALVAVILAALLTFNQLRHWRDSISLFEQALRVTTGNAVAHNNLGYALLNQGRLDEAISHFEASIRINFNRSNAHNNLGLALQKKGLAEEAAREYEIAIKLDPSHDTAHNNLGALYADHGMYDEAIAEFEKALRINPDNALAGKNLRLAMKLKNRGP